MTTSRTTFTRAAALLQLLQTLFLAGAPDRGEAAHPFASASSSASTTLILPPRRASSRRAGGIDLARPRPGPARRGCLLRLPLPRPSACACRLAPRRRGLAASPVTAGGGGLAAWPRPSAPAPSADACRASPRRFQLAPLRPAPSRLRRRSIVLRLGQRRPLRRRLRAASSLRPRPQPRASICGQRFLRCAGCHRRSLTGAAGSAGLTILLRLHGVLQGPDARRLLLAGQADGGAFARLAVGARRPGEAAHRPRPSCSRGTSARPARHRWRRSASCGLRPSPFSSGRARSSAEPVRSPPSSSAPASRAACRPAFCRDRRYRSSSLTSTALRSGGPSHARSVAACRCETRQDGDASRIRLVGEPAAARAPRARCAPADGARRARRRVNSVDHRHVAAPARAACGARPPTPSAAARSRPHAPGAQPFRTFSKPNTASPARTRETRADQGSARSKPLRPAAIRSSGTRTGGPRGSGEQLAVRRPYRRTARSALTHNPRPGSRSPRSGTIEPSGDRPRSGSADRRSLAAAGEAPPFAAGAPSDSSALAGRGAPRRHRSSAPFTRRGSASARHGWDSPRPPPRRRRTSGRAPP